MNQMCKCAYKDQIYINQEYNLSAIAQREYKCIQLDPSEIYYRELNS